MAPTGFSARLQQQRAQFASAAPSLSNGGQNVRSGGPFQRGSLTKLSKTGSGTTSNLPRSSSLSGSVSRNVPRPVQTCSLKKENGGQDINAVLVNRQGGKKIGWGSAVAPSPEQNAPSSALGPTPAGSTAEVASKTTETERKKEEKGGVPQPERHPPLPPPPDENNRNVPWALHPPAIPPTPADEPSQAKDSRERSGGDWSYRDGQQGPSQPRDHRDYPGPRFRDFGENVDGGYNDGVYERSRFASGPNDRSNYESRQYARGGYDTWGGSGSGNYFRDRDHRGRDRDLRDSRDYRGGGYDFGPRHDYRDSREYSGHHRGGYNFGERRSSAPSYDYRGGNGSFSSRERIYRSDDDRRGDNFFRDSRRSFDQGVRDFREPNRRRFDDEKVDNFRSSERTDEPTSTEDSNYNASHLHRSNEERGKYEENVSRNPRAGSWRQSSEENDQVHGLEEPQLVGESDMRHNTVREVEPNEIRRQPYKHAEGPDCTRADTQTDHQTADELVSKLPKEPIIILRNSNQAEEAPELASDHENTFQAHNLAKPETGVTEVEEPDYGEEGRSKINLESLKASEQDESVELEPLPSGQTDDIIQNTNEDPQVTPVVEYEHEPKPESTPEPSLEQNPESKREPEQEPEAMSEPKREPTQKHPPVEPISEAELRREQQQKILRSVAAARSKDSGKAKSKPPHAKENTSQGEKKTEPVDNADFPKKKDKHLRKKSENRHKGDERRSKLDGTKSETPESKGDTSNENDHSKKIPRGDRRRNREPKSRDADGKREKQPKEGAEHRNEKSGKRENPKQKERGSADPKKNTRREKEKEKTQNKKDCSEVPDLDASEQNQEQPNTEREKAAKRSSTRSENGDKKQKRQRDRAKEGSGETGSKEAKEKTHDGASKQKVFIPAPPPAVSAWTAGPPPGIIKPRQEAYPEGAAKQTPSAEMSLEVVTAPIVANNVEMPEPADVVSQQLTNGRLASWIPPPMEAPDGHQLVGTTKFAAVSPFFGSWEAFTAGVPSDWGGDNGAESNPLLNEKSEQSEPILIGDEENKKATKNTKNRAAGGKGPRSKRRDGGRHRDHRRGATSKGEIGEEESSSRPSVEAKRPPDSGTPSGKVVDGAGKKTRRRKPKKQQVGVANDNNRT